MVGEAAFKSEAEIGEVSKVCNPWVVGGVKEVCRHNCSKIEGNSWDLAGLKVNPNQGSCWRREEGCR